MCGFLFMETSDLTIEEFKSNLELIEHRGPDDQQHVRDTLGNDFWFLPTFNHGFIRLGTSTLWFKWQKSYV